MNVHGFRDLNNEPNNRPADNYQNLNDNIPLTTNIQADRPPLEQTVPYTLKLICCPTLKLRSISTVMFFVFVAVYVFCCTQGIITANKNILEIDPNVLIDYGAMQDILLAKWQVWRLLTASLLHMNLLHITMNSICFVFLLSRLQKSFKIPELTVIIVASAIAGNILSALCNKKGTISAGASGIILGIIGAYLAFMTINWKTLANYGDMRSQLCCTVGILVFFSLLFSLGSDVDMYGHLGGMIGGYFVSLGVLPALREKSKRLTTMGWSVFGGYLALTLILFFLNN